MDLLAAMRTLIRVAETGSFSAVAQERGSTQSAISHQMTALEEFLGARLLHRSTRNVALSDEGSVVLTHAYRMRDVADAAIDAVQQRRAEPSGYVRIAMTVMGGTMIAGRLRDLLTRYPELSIELVAGDMAHDMVGEGIDVWVRIGEAEQGSLITRRVGVAEYVLVAAPDYLLDRAEPLAPADLAQHDCIVRRRYGEDDVWRFEGPAGQLAVRVRGRFSANNTESVRQAAISGIGIALLPLKQTKPEIAAGRLRPVLPQFRPIGMPVSIVYTSRRDLPLRTRVVIDFLIAEIREMTGGAPRHGNGSGAGRRAAARRQGEAGIPQRTA